MESKYIQYSGWWPQLVCFRVLVGRHQEHHAANQYGLTTKEYWLNKKLKAVVLGHQRLKNSKIFLAISGKNLKLGSQYSPRDPYIQSYLPDVFHGAHLHKGDARSGRLQEGLVNSGRVVEHRTADHSKRHCSTHHRGITVYQ